MECSQKCDVCGSGRILSLDRMCNICKCAECEYVFHDPRPTIDEIIEYYSRAHKYDSWIREEKGKDALWRRRLEKIKIFKRGGAILDIGAGIGQFLFHARNDFEICGTEISESAIKIARDKYGVCLIKGSLENIDFGDRRFDVITLFHVLEHASSPSSVIEKCRSLLAKDGIVIIAIPNEINSLMSFIKRPIKWMLSALSISRRKRYGVYGLPKIDLSNNPDEVHLSYFTNRCLEKLLVKRRLTIIYNTLDPYYSTTGIRRRVDDLVYFIFLMFKNIFHVNLYDAIWVVAKYK